jgi:hypothetical protein
MTTAANGEFILMGAVTWSAASRPAVPRSGITGITIRTRRTDIGA